MPYYYSPSRRRVSWTAPGTSPEEDAELEEYYAVDGELEVRERPPSVFEAENPMRPGEGN